MAIATASKGLSHDGYRKAGYWLDKPIDQLLTEAVAKTPDKIAVVADRADRDAASHTGNWKAWPNARPTRCAGWE